MKDQESPIKVFQNWYSSQPKEVQDTVGLFILTKVPRFIMKEFDVLMRPKETLFSYLDAIGGNTAEILGETLLLRAIVDFSVMRRFAGAEDWEMKKESNIAIAGDIESEQGPNPMSNELRDMVLKFPERQKLWANTAKSWKALRNSSLSDEFLEACEQNSHLASGE